MLKAGCVISNLSKWSRLTILGFILSLFNEIIVKVDMNIINNIFCYEILLLKLGGSSLKADYTPPGTVPGGSGVKSEYKVNYESECLVYLSPCL